jgi:polyisoprenoid-binding protein YceI
MIGAMNLMRRLQTLAVLLAISAMAAGTCQAADRYVIDPVHTRVAFRVMHAGFSPSIGTVSKPTGTLYFDEKNIANSKVSIDIDLSTLDMGDAEWTRKVAIDFLNAEKYPKARFQSSSVQVISESFIQVTGDLQMAGGSTPITFIAILNAHKRHPLTLKKTLGLQASADFSRKALGVDQWSLLVGDRVHLDISLEATRAEENTKEIQP